MNEDTLTNPFARVLVFYYNYARSKLNESDLSKVAKKYKNKPQDLLADLARKYAPFNVPSAAPLCDVLRVCANFSVPKIFTALALPSPALAESKTFCPQADILCDQFDAEFVLRNEILHAPLQAAAPLDNLSKVGLMLFKEDGSLKSISAAQTMNNDTALRLAQERANRARLQSSSANSEEKVHPFDAIREAAIPTVTCKDSSGAARVSESPLKLLKVFQESLQRVRIVIRRKGCVRGSIDAYIKAFDRHFNMLLSDADETYITNRHRKRKLSRGTFLCNDNVLRRHLPQLLVRGDNVVSVFPLPRS